MTHREYREAFDRISFSPDFPERTEALLRRQADSAAAEAFAAGTGLEFPPMEREEPQG